MKRKLFLTNIAILAAVLFGGLAYSDTFSFTQNTPFVFQGSTTSSVLSVSGIIGNVTDVNITLNGLRVNTFSQGVSEIDLLLVGPQGQHVILISYVCQAFTSSGPFDFTLDGSAASALPAGNSGTSCVNGTFLPSDYHDQTVFGYILGPPAPAPPYSTNLANFNNVNPAGNWTLYAAEHEGNEGGTIDSWTLTIETDGVPAACTYEDLFDDNVLTYQQLKPSIQEIGGNLVAQPTNKKAYTISDPSFTGIQNGTITADLTFSTNDQFKEKGWMVTHWINKKNLMEIQFNIARGKVIVKQKAGIVLAKAKGDFVFAFSTPYSVQATYTGSVYEVRIDGVLVVSLTPVGTIPSGILGFEAKGLTESINSVCVSP